MKQAFLLSFVILAIFLFSGCKKEEVVSIPKISTTPVTNISVVSITSGGIITSDGGAKITSRGIYWGPNFNPTSADSATNDGEGIGRFVSHITSLTGNQEYHIRAYAINSVGTAYGADITFTTKTGIPIISTLPITDIKSSGVIGGGNISSDGGSDIIARGVVWNTNPNQTIEENKTSDGAGTGAFTSTISGLSESTTYYIRAYATNSAGTGYGSEIAVTTIGEKPTCSTLEATMVKSASATLNGTVNAHYLSTVVSFEYGTSTLYQQSVICPESPVSGFSLIYVSANVSGLSEFTTYHFRIKAVNSLGTSYGDDMIFSSGGKVSDYEGNVYQTVVTGNKEWMQDNFRATKFNDGTDIPFATNNIAFSQLTTPGYCWYNNDEASYKNTYGAIYNYYAANADNLCPTGWHVPGLAEWTALIDSLGGSKVAGGKLKEPGIANWASPNIRETNISHFSGLPGGIIGSWDGSWPFRGIHTEGNWWTSTKSTDSSNSISWVHLQNNTIESYIFEGTNAENVGMSVRCVKD